MLVKIVAGSDCRLSVLPHRFKGRVCSPLYPLCAASNACCKHCRTVVDTVVQVHPADAAAVDEATCRQVLGRDDRLTGHVASNNVLGLQARSVQEAVRLGLSAPS